MKNKQKIGHMKKLITTKNLLVIKMKISKLISESGTLKLQLQSNKEN